LKSRAGVIAVWTFALWALAGFALGVAAVALGSPSINAVLELLGREESLKRMDQQLENFLNGVE